MEPSRFHRGDDAGWAATDLDDSDWTVEHPSAEAGRDGQWWARVRFHIEPGFESHDALVVYIYTLASYEIHWDGVPIGRNGQPGADAEREVPGSHFKSIAIPKDKLAPGPHVLALRMSNWRTVVPSDYFRIEAGPLETMTLRRQLFTGFYTAVFALVLMAGLSFLAYGRQREPMARFGWLCIAVAILLALEQGKYVALYPYPLHFYRLVAITTCTMAVAVLLPWFLMARFRFAGRVYLAAATIPPLLAPFLWLDPDLHCYWIFVYALAFSLFLCVLAARQGRAGWAPVSAVIGLCLVLITLTGDRFADRWFFPAFLLLVALLAGRLIWETRAWREALAAEQLTSSRLKLELLRKSIQPHFLKNTLAAAMSWFEENPEKGGRLLGSLADELDCFFRIGDRDRVRLDEELTLCRHHVETMSYLLDCPVALSYKGPTTGIDLPPGLLITCVENALTHGRFGEGRHEIEVDIDLTDDRLRIRTANPAAPADAFAEGTGTRYLRALLTRHYPEAWSHTQGFDGRQWATSIVIQPFSDETRR